MMISEQLEERVQKKYEEAIKLGVSSIILDEERLGELMLYINEKPAYVIASFEAGTDKIYVGAATMIGTP